VLKASKASVFLEMAETLSQLGTCDRAQVGAIIIKDGRCISWGYNGAPPGLPHCDENGHGWGSKLADNIEVYGCRNTIHAEANALAFAARQGISTDGAQMFTTVSPCLTCAKSIIAAGITDVHYLTEYRLTDAIELLDEAHIYTHHHGY